MKNSLPVVLNLTGLAMHKIFRAHNPSPKSRANSLMSQANPKQRNLASEMSDHFNADSSFLRSARTRRKQDAFRMHRSNLIDCYFIVATNRNLSAEFPKILDKVVGKRIVVVENEDHGTILAVGTISSRVQSRRAPVAIV